MEALTNSMTPEAAGILAGLVALTGADPTFLHSRLISLLAFAEIPVVAAELQMFDGTSTGDIFTVNPGATLSLTFPDALSGYRPIVEGAAGSYVGVRLDIDDDSPDAAILAVSVTGLNFIFLGVPVKIPRASGGYDVVMPANFVCGSTSATIKLKNPGASAVTVVLSGQAVPPEAERAVLAAESQTERDQGPSAHRAAARLADLRKVARAPIVAVAAVAGASADDDDDDDEPSAVEALLDAAPKGTRGASQLVDAARSMAAHKRTRKRAKRGAGKSKRVQAAPGFTGNPAGSGFAWADASGNIDPTKRVYLLNGSVNEANSINLSLKRAGYRVVRV